MDVWTGSIALNPDHQLEGILQERDSLFALLTTLTGIRLVDPTSRWQCDIPKDAKLGLRSFVNPALIPLHARAGPNLEFHTSSAATSQWLQRKLTGAIWLHENEFELHQSMQCPSGLLVSVEGTSSKKTGAVTSDVLIYGVLSSATSCARPPTPPHSSPSETNGQANAPSSKPCELRIYAAPLSTAILTQAQAFPSPPQSSGGEHVPTQAEFLPDISSPSPKRKRVATLFEVAAQHHRRVRQRGGEAVSQLMATSRPLSSSPNLQALRVKREPEDDSPSLPSLDRIAGHRSRSASIGTNLQRPGSRFGRATPALSADPQKRVPTPNRFLDNKGSRGAQQIQSSVSLAASTEGNTLPTPDSPPQNPESIIAENKHIITRTILTCMRLYGFHRSNTRPSTSKATPGDLDPETTDATPVPEGSRAETPAPAISADDDEFKAMYHATYKAAAFALRKYLKDAPSGAGATPRLLEKGKAMTCIDELLRLFCEDH